MPLGHKPNNLPQLLLFLCSDLLAETLLLHRNYASDFFSGLSGSRTNSHVHYQRQRKGFRPKTNKTKEKIPIGCATETLSENEQTKEKARIEL